MAVVSFAIAACGSTPSPKSRNSVRIDGGKLAWVDFLTVSKIHRDAFPQKSGESIYLFSFSQEVSVRLSTGLIVTNSEGEPAISCVRQLPAPVPAELFSECLHTLNDANLKQSRKNTDLGKLLSRAETAIRSEGTCQWLGFDRNLDRRVRAVGSAARQGDERLFFAKLKC
ncbi:MAG: hypothetical protein ABJZ90_23825 [Paracoccaceae bacterium]